VTPQLFDNVRQFTIPSRFSGHDASLRYCAPAQFRQVPDER
jgi:hypothetical protein